MAGYESFPTSLLVDYHQGTAIWQAYPGTLVIMSQRTDKPGESKAGYRKEAGTGLAGAENERASQKGPRSQELVITLTLNDGCS